MIEEKVVLGVDTEVATRSMKDLRNEIKDAKNEMLNAAEGTDKYKNALKKAADASFELKEMNNKVRQSAGDLGEILLNGQRVLSGIASGYAAAQGAIALFGIENVDLQKTLVKVQAATALLAGLEGLEGLGKTLSNLGTQLKSTAAGVTVMTKVQAAWNYVLSINPVILIVTGIIALGAAVYALTNYLKDNNSEQERQNKLYQDSLDNRKMFNREIDYELQRMKIRKSSIKEQFDYERKMIYERQTYLNQNTVFDEERIEDMSELQKKRNEENIKELEELNNREYSLNVRQDLAVEKAAQDADDEKKKMQDEFHKKNLEEIKKRNEDVKKIQEEYNIKDIENLEDLRGDIKDIDDQIITDMLNISQSANEQMIENENKRIESKIQAQTLYDDLTKTELEKLTDKYNFEKELLIKNGMDTVNLEKSYSEAKIAIAEKEAAAKRQQLANLGNALGAASDLAGKKTGEGKALAIAQTTINTYLSAQEAYASLAAIPLIGPALGAAAAAVAIGAGLKNIQAINKVKVPGSQSATSISSPAFSAPQLPQNITATRNQLTGSEVNLQAQPVKTYVVESELTAKQELSKKREQESTF